MSIKRSPAWYSVNFHRCRAGSSSRFKWSYCNSECGVMQVISEVDAAHELRRNRQGRRGVKAFIIIGICHFEF